MWRGLKPAQGLHPNDSTNARSLLRWCDESAPSSRPQTASGPNPRARPQSALVTGTTAAPPPPPANPLLTYSKFGRELAHTNHVRSQLFGAAFTDLSAFPSATAAAGQPGDVLIKSPPRRPASAYYPSTTTAVYGTKESDDAPSVYGSSPSSPYVARSVGRNAEDGLVEKIGTFPPPTPLEPDTHSWFIDNTYTTNLAFYNAPGRMGPGQRPTTRLGKHGDELEEVEADAPLYSYRDPPMEGPLYSSFHSDHVFREWSVAPVSSAYRSKVSVPRPLSGGRFGPATEERLFLQRLSRDLKSQPKDDVRVRTSDRTVADLQAKSEARRVYDTVMGDEARKRRILEQAERRHREHVHELQRFQPKRQLLQQQQQQQSGDASSDAHARFDVQGYLDGGARTPSDDSPYQAGRRVTSSPSPPRSISPNPLDRFAWSEQAVTFQWPAKSNGSRGAAATTASAKPVRPHSAFVHSARANSNHTADDTAENARRTSEPNDGSSHAAVRGMRRTLLNMRADANVLQAFATLAPVPLVA